MKKYLLIAVCLMLLLVTGCDMKKKITVGDKADANMNPSAGLDEGIGSTYEGAVMTYVSSDSHSLTVTISNNTESTWQSGNMRDYELQVMKDGEWYKVEQIGEFANTMELLIFSPGESMTHTFAFDARYGELTEGSYRVIKAYWANRTENSDAREFHLWCEFEVE